MPKHIKPDGPLDAQVAFIGEAPGGDEDRLGRPFVGASGAAFSEYLNAVGLRRSKVFIHNVIPVRPPRNNIEVYIRCLTSGKRKGEIEMTDDYHLYERDLYEQLNRCTANVIVAMGNVALWALCRKWGIEKWRGSMLPAVSALNGRKVIPTLHPAASLYDPINQIPIKLDLHRVVTQSATPALTYMPRTYHTFPAFTEVLEYIRECELQQEVGFDIETKPCGGTKKQPATWEVSCLALALSEADAMCIPFLGPEGLYWAPNEHTAIMAALARLLENQAITKVGQNINFDCSFMLAKHGILCWPVYDTLVAQRMLLPDLPVGLDFITSIYTDLPYYKDEGKQWEGVRDWAEFYEYNAKDAVVCMEAKPKQLFELDRLHNTAVYDRHIATFPSLLYMQQRGVRSDYETLKLLSAEMAAEIDQRQQELLDRVRAVATTYKGRTGKEAEYNEKFANSPDQCKAFFYGALRHKPYTKWDKKRGISAVTTDDEAMVRLSRKGVREANMVLKIRELRKLKGTYLDMPLDDGRFKTTYMPCVKTGRLSSSQNIFGYGGNLQTIPREGPFKKAFLVDDGYVLASLDSSQAEARVLAYCGQVTTKIAAIESGTDMYATTASNIAKRLGYDLTIEEVLEQHHAKVMAPIANESKTWRGWGKECDLALGYNMGPDKFSRRVELPITEARTLHTAWHLVYPEVRAIYHAMIQSMLSNGRIVLNPFGRRRKFLGKRSDILEDAYSHFCQSTVADVIAEWALVPLAYDEAFAEAELLLQIHDSVVVQLPVALGWSTIADTLMALKQSMEQPLSWNGATFNIPASVEISGVSLGQTVELSVVTAESIEQAYEQTRRAA